MARLSLIDAIPIPGANVHPVRTDLPSPAEAAADYHDALIREFGEGPPRFDLILLGLGDDGHTASLFPGALALSAGDRWAINSPPGVLPPPVDRITLTFPVLNAARRVLFLVVGVGKADAVRDILDRGASVIDRPAAGVKPVDGEVTWLLDEAAASGVAAESDGANRDPSSYEVV